MYDIKTANLQVHTSVYPPIFYLEVTINHDADVIASLLVKYTLIFESGDNSFEFIESISPKKDGHTKQSRLALDYHSFRHVSSRFKGASSPRVVVNVDLLSRGGHRLASGQISQRIEPDQWVIACNADNKPRPSETISPVDASSIFMNEIAAQLHGEIAKIKEDLSADRMAQLQKKVFAGQVEAIKEYLLDQAEFKDLKQFEPLIAICSLMKLDLRWAIAAGLLASLEGYMKNWLVTHAAEKLEEMKNKQFEELIAKIRSTLIAKGITIQQKKLSDLAGKRHLRNQVLHEMYVPTDGEIREIKDESIEFVQYLDSLTKT